MKFSFLLLCLFYVIPCSFAQPQMVTVRGLVKEIIRKKDDSVYQTIRNIQGEFLERIKKDQPAEWYFCQAAYNIHENREAGASLASIHLAMRYLESSHARTIPDDQVKKMESLLQIWLYDETAADLAQIKNIKEIDDNQRVNPKWRKGMLENFPSCWLGQITMAGNSAYQTILTKECDFKYPLTRILCADAVTDSARIWSTMAFREFDGGVTIILEDKDSTTAILNKTAPYLAILIEKYLVSNKQSIKKIEIEVEYPPEVWNDQYTQAFYKGSEVIFKQAYFLNNVEKAVTIPSGAKLKNSDLGLLRLMYIGRYFRLSYEDAMAIPEPVYSVYTDRLEEPHNIRIHFTFHTTTNQK